MEIAAEESVDTQVRPAAGKCFDLFESALQATGSALDATTRTNPDVPTLLYYLIIERNELRLWAAKAAVFAEDQSSLDYRLREFPENMDRTRSLIDAVCSRLLSYISAIRKDVAVNGLPSDTDLEAPGIEDKAGAILAAPKFEIFNYENALESIRTGINWLQNLSGLIFPYQGYKRPVRGFDGLRASFAQVVARDFPRLSEQLKSRVASMMVVRYRRMLYLRDRYPSGRKQQREHQHKDQAASPERAAETELPSKDDEPPASDITKQQKVAENRSMEETDILLPPPPKSCQTESSFTCEFCWVILPSNIGRNRVLWSEHVTRDLDSYVCLLERCDIPYCLFTSRQEWLHHMKSERLAKWICRMPHDGEAVVKFEREELLGTHIIKPHPNMFSPDQLLDVANVYRRTAEVVFEACPFCHETPGNDIEEHIAHHLRYLALKSAQWQDNDCKDEEYHVERSVSFALVDNTIGRGTLDHSIGSQKHLGDDRGWVVISEYDSEAFLASEELKWADATSDEDDRQAE
ncbi:hypothetical protein GGR51DRAFT_504840 [Nemania sp. FL0031]|nr:hypothetical protein GGR51DRAFT_504840 [Nemania sp. FL0031]